jgi:hypothetical protein
MVYRERYTSPFRTVQLIERQAAAPENVNFAAKNFSGLKTGLQVWEAIKPKVIFKNDPPNIETVQGITTFFDPSKNIHSLSGAGDCDCFTSVLASIAKANNLPYRYILQGNSKPSHIAISINGTVCDLTNNIPNYLRPYNKTQTIEPMYVQLSDEAIALSDLAAGGRGKQKVKTFAKKYGKVIVPAAAIGASLLIPGSGKIIQVAAKKVPGLLQKGAKLINANKGLIATTASNFLKKQNITPAAIPQGNLPVAMPANSSNYETESTASTMPIYETAPVTVTAQKMNQLLIVGGLALAYFLFNKKR